MSTNEDDVALISWLNCMIDFVPKNEEEAYTKIQSLDEIRKVRFFVVFYRFKSLGLTTQNNRIFSRPLQSLHVHLHHILMI